MDEYSVIEATMSILLRGGWVLLPLFLIGWLGWFLMFERFGYYLMLKGRSTTKFFKDLDAVGEEAAFANLNKRVLAISVRLSKTCASTVTKALWPCVMP